MGCEAGLGIQYPISTKHEDSSFVALSMTSSWKKGVGISWSYFICACMPVYDTGSALRVNLAMHTFACSNPLREIYAFTRFQPSMCEYVA